MSKKQNRQGMNLEDDDTAVEPSTYEYHISCEDLIVEGSTVVSSLKD